MDSRPTAARGVQFGRPVILVERSPSPDGGGNGAGET